MKHLCVIGGGPGGYAAAFHAADHGMQVTLVDAESTPGGVCLLRGCIPSKALLHAARVIHEAKAAAAMGVNFGEPALDMAKLRAFKDGVVGKLTGGLTQLAKGRSVRFLRGRAHLADARTVAVALEAGGEETLQPDFILLASGSRPVRIPSFPAPGGRVMDSTGALALADVPASLLVVGGGYIGLELGSVYAALGARVSVVEMTGTLLPGADRDLVAVLERRLRKDFAAIHLDTKVTSMREERDAVHVGFESGGGAKEEMFERILVSVGRRPNSDDLGLEQTAIETDRRGFVVTDGQRRTAEAHIFAIGDVAGEPMLAHKASHEGKLAVDVMLGSKARFEPAAIPAVVFTDPEIAWCGLTDAQAKTDGKAVEVAKFPWGASGRAQTVQAEGLTKILAEPGTGRVLGVGIAGPGAGDLIGEGVLAIEMGATVRDLSLSIHAHPTLSETLMEAAEVNLGLSTHVLPRRKGSSGGD